MWCCRVRLAEASLLLGREEGRRGASKEEGAGQAAPEDQGSRQGCGSR